MRLIGKFTDWFGGLSTPQQVAVSTVIAVVVFGSYGAALLVLGLILLFDFVTDDLLGM